MKKIVWLLLAALVVAAGFVVWRTQSNSVPDEVSAVLRGILQVKYSDARENYDPGLYKERLAEEDVVEIKVFEDFADVSLKPYMTDSCYKRVLSDGFACRTWAYSYRTNSDITIESVNYLGKEEKLGRNFLKYEVVLVVSSDSRDAERISASVEFDVLDGLVDYVMIGGVDWFDPR